MKIGLIRINFCDFWPGFVKHDNYIYNTLNRNFAIEISDQPDVLFYSCYGKDYLNYTCIRVFYASENVRSDFSGCDYALTFDYLNDPRHYRLPLYAFYIDQNKRWNEITRLSNDDELISNWKQKTGFCCMVVSNGLAKKRISFFNSLTKIRKVDSGGRYLNNIGGPVINKHAFISNYRFVIAFENSSYPGYTTEKILDPLLVGSIPIYWGNSKVGLDFNSKRFLNYHDFKNEKELIEIILELDRNVDKVLEILKEPIFPENEIPKSIREENIVTFFRGIFSSIDQITPVAKTTRRIKHNINLKIRTLSYYLNKALDLNYR